MKKLLAFIKKAYETGRIYPLTLSDFRTLEGVATALQTVKEAEFIQGSIAELLTKFNITVKPCGCGFKAVRK